MIKPVMALALMAGIAAGPAQGASLSFSNAESLTPISQNGLLALFDTNIGILQSVRLTLVGTGSSTFTLTNTAGISQDVTATSRIPMYFSSSLPGISATLDALMPALLLEASTGQVVLAPGTSSSFGPIVSTQSLALDSLAPSLFSQAGGGSFYLYCENSDEKGLAGGNTAVSVNLVTQAGCGATVVYDYTPYLVSEPVSAALVGLGVMGLLARRRRARRFARSDA
ncbi:choice-of-anchor E domain-containing protein [Zoogloea sp.]|uniref:choice-of-anchor E domain-containing protein n=1 Tax=Zoogloea sp. TaxID=49181 RepID=UPI001A53EA9C|nr:choice-of-anchor E domain-containing protein [Zoogloea sp.]